MPDFDVLVEQLKQHPQLQWYATQQRIAQSQINLAQITAQPAWRVSVGASRTEEWDDYSMMASLTIPFGGEHRNDGQIRALNAQQNQQQAQADAWQQRMFTQILLLTHKLKHNLHVIDGLQTSIIPALESANDYAKSAYQQGSYRYSDWYAVQQDLLAAKQQLISAYANMQRFSVERERLIGARLQGSPTQSSSHSTATTEQVN
jgi:cobalt-zinc-cadmium efflux system outer membrane protein